MKIWLDDTREMPKGFDVWCKTADEAWKIIVKDSPDNFISFDHDLGGKYTGYDVAKLIEAGAFQGWLINPVKWEIHSQNPVGRENIKMAMNAADKFWNAER